MSKDWFFRTDGYICDLRVVGVLIHNNKLLVQRNRDDYEYALPGGHVQIGESTIDSLIREYKEETGANIRVRRLIWTEECFWEWNDTQAHSIAFYYLIDLDGSSGLLNMEGAMLQKDNCNVILEWMPIDELVNITIYPNFIKKSIFDLDAPQQHFISRG